MSAPGPKALVTGATGLVGWNIVKTLLARGRPVRALVRSLEKAKASTPSGCELARGDVTEPASVAAALEGCGVVYHAAGLPEQWLPDPDTFRRVNVEGTRNVLDAARRAGARAVYTSTIDVFQAGRGESYDESVIDPAPKGTPYERSKQDADRVAVEAQKGGLPVVFLHPAGLYGPGPAGSPGMNQLVIDLSRGKVPALLPGGMPVVFSEDVGEGHVLAEEKGAPGDRFILSEAYHELTEIARVAGEELGLRGTPRVLPLWAGRLLSRAGEGLSSLTGRPPLVPRGQLHFLQWGAKPRSDRAQEQLGWRPTPLREGLAKAVAWLREAGAIAAATTPR